MTFVVSLVEIEVSKWHQSQRSIWSLYSMTWSCFIFVISGPFFKKIVADSNAPVQEKALDALLAFLRTADADAGRWVVFFFFGYWILHLGLFNCICQLIVSTYSDHTFFRYAKEVCDSIVAKCLTGRPKTVEKAQAAFMLWVELEAVDVFLVPLIFNLVILPAIDVKWCWALLVDFNINKRNKPFIF